MAILDRLSFLLRANVHAAVDRAEDPEKVLDQLIRDAEAGRQAGQQQLVEIVTQRNRIAAEAAHEEKLARKALTQAETAVRNGNDELAREALRRRHDAIEAAGLYSQQAEAQQLMVDRLRTQLGQVDTKLRRMRQERTNLAARKRAADAQATIVNATIKLGEANVEGEFARMSRRVRQSEALAAASLEVYSDTLSGRLDVFEDERVEAQLQALKGSTATDIDLLGDPLLIALEGSSDRRSQQGAVLE